MTRFKPELIEHLKAAAAKDMSVEDRLVIHQIVTAMIDLNALLSELELLLKTFKDYKDTIVRVGEFAANLDKIALQHDGSTTGHTVLVIAKELRDCLNNTETDSLPLPKRFYR